ncbi:hypothetical protein [uncultured Bacteroides sp.]|uniref:hypothetical protein n=1 Tax=uncultured Bacteroides sp. TaxID=162156 RepID=UPI002AA7DDC0|nr:hypothetical protein [uncultured Bacteroides sp.]
MKIKLIILILITSFAIKAMGQVNDNSIRQQVLKENIVDSLFVFGRWTINGGTETHLKYLGQVMTSDGRIFKIMDSCWFWGLSHRATSRILIFNGNNQYVGNYCLGMINDLPDKLENGILIFTNTDNEDCDKSIITKVDLTKGLPEHIFLRCEGENGDLYSFSTE